VLRVALKGVLARKSRLALTAIAVVLGTAFLSGSSVFTATINRTFDQLFADVFADVDAFVRSPEKVESDFGPPQRQPIPLAITEEVRAVPGVADVAPTIQSYARIIGSDGKPIGSAGAGPPTFGSAITDSPVELWTVVDGRLPVDGTEVALDEASAAEGGYSVGDTVRVVAGAGSREFELVGIASYGDVRSPGGATFALFEIGFATEFLGTPGYIDAVLVVGDGTVSDEDLAARITEQVSGDVAVETLTGAEITAEQQDEIADALSFFGILLTVFSFIALGVGCFVIYNVFSISAAQRQRENALLRALGASRRQVTQSMLVESVVVGTFGSGAGLLAGIGLSVGLSSALKASGIDLPSSGLVVQGSTVVSTIIIGLIVTVSSALLPAFRSGRVPPLAAMRDTALDTAGPTRVRLSIGLGAVAAGIAVIGTVMGGADVALLGLGILFVFAGVLVLGPVIARPAALAIGRPIGMLRGVTGAMARQNAARNPKRTARTAAPVLIGVALVTAVTALAASIKTEIRTVFGEQFTGDYSVTSDSFGFGGLSPSLADALNELDVVDKAAGIGASPAQVNGDGTLLTVVDPATVGALFDLGFTVGSADALTAEGILISESTADKKGLAVGSTLSVNLGDGVERTLTVQGIYARDELASRYVVSRDLYAGSTVGRFDFSVFILRAPGVDDAEARARLQAVVDEYGDGRLLDKEQYIEEQAGQVNQLLGLIYGLLALSIVIAIVGIVITLLLSVYERRREIGLLRAVGMTRSQVRTTVRWESVITSLLGAVMGIALGIGLGWVVILALRDEGITQFTLPVGSAVWILVLSFVTGVVAAAYPARRATRVDVLEALTTT
jgi:putative ABC transport system permease protein